MTYVSHNERTARLPPLPCHYQRMHPFIQRGLPPSPTHSEFRVIKVVESSRNVTESQKEEKRDDKSGGGLTSRRTSTRRQTGETAHTICPTLSQGHGEGRETNGQTGGESNVCASSSLAVDDARGNDLNIFRVVCRPRVLRTGGIARVGPRVLFALSCNTTPYHPKGWFTSEDGVTHNNPGYCKMG